MTSTDEALLQAILAHPEDDLPRLVYADWLEENGFSDRAEFIRIQCEFARHATIPKELSSWGIREKFLLDRHAKSWLAPLRAKGEALQNAGTHGLFRRGFVETVWMPASIFAWKADRLFNMAPVTELRVTRMNFQELDELLATPELSRLLTLDLSTHRLGPECVEKLLRCSSLQHLRCLRLRGCFRDFFVPHDLWDALWDMETAWPNLRELDLTNNGLDDQTVRRLRERFGTVLVMGPSTTNTIEF